MNMGTKLKLFNNIGEKGYRLLNMSTTVVPDPPKNLYNFSL